MERTSAQCPQYSMIEHNQIYITRVCGGPNSHVRWVVVIIIRLETWVRLKIELYLCYLLYFTFRYQSELSCYTHATFYSLLGWLLIGTSLQFHICFDFKARLSQQQMASGWVMGGILPVSIWHNFRSFNLISFHTLLVVGPIYHLTIFKIRPTTGTRASTNVRQNCDISIGQMNLGLPILGL